MLIFKTFKANVLLSNRSIGFCCSSFKTFCYPGFNYSLNGFYGFLPGSIRTQPALVAPIPPAPSVQGDGVSDSEVDKEDDTGSVASEGHPEDIDEPEDLVSLNV